MDALDRDLFSLGTENPIDKVGRLLGVQVSSYANAKKLLRGARLYAERKQKLQGSANTAPEEVRYSADGTRTYSRDILLSEDEANDPASVMRKLGFDPLKWELIDLKVRKGNWDTTVKDANSEPKTTINYTYSVTIKVKPITGSMLTIDALINALEGIEIPSIANSTPRPRDGEYMLELPIMDVHLGKLSWGEEAGADYDLKIASQLYRQTIDDLISKASTYPITQIVFPIGQDFYHFDTPFTQTTGGTQLDSDTRWQKMYRKGFELLLEAIEKCRQIAPVKVMWVPGNHDEMLSYTAVVGLSHFYVDKIDVNVDISPTPRKYMKWGKVLLGYSHGREEGKRINSLMQVEAPHLWAGSEFREWHIGDLHHEAVKEEGGIIYRIVSTITAPDAWHTQKGYIGATRKGQAFVWSKGTGLEAVFNSMVKIQSKSPQPAKFG
jgi:hypothetical protein